MAEHYGNAPVPLVAVADEAWGWAGASPPRWSIPGEERGIDTWSNPMTCSTPPDRGYRIGSVRQAASDREVPQ